MNLKVWATNLFVIKRSLVGVLEKHIFAPIVEQKEWAESKLICCLGPYYYFLDQILPKNCIALGYMWDVRLEFVWQFKSKKSGLTT